MPLLTKDRAVVDDRWIAAARNGGDRRRAGFDARHRSARAVVGAARCAGGPRRYRRVAEARRRSGRARRRRRAAAADRRRLPEVRRRPRLLDARVCCAKDTATPANCARSATSCATSSITCGSAASTRSRCSPAATSHDALAAFDDFSDNYQATVAQPVPLFRRRASGRGNRVAGVERRFKPMSIEARVADVVMLLSRVARDHAPAALASSFGAEDMVLIDLVARHALPIEILTLDTGRLPDETHVQIDRVRERYGLTIHVLHPDAAALQAFVAANGANAFYRSIELRQACCAIRKADPLARGTRRKARLDHRPAPLAVDHARRSRRRGIRRRARPAQVQSAGRLERGRRVALPAVQCGPLQSAARSGLSQHRLRAVHACRSSRARTSARAAGGGNNPSTASAGCIAGRSTSRYASIPAGVPA